MPWVEVSLMSLCNAASAAKVFWTLNNAPGTCIKVQVQEMALHGARSAWEVLEGRSEGLMKADNMILGLAGTGSKLAVFAWLCLGMMNLIDQGGLSRASSVLRVYFIYIRYLLL